MLAPDHSGSVDPACQPFVGRYAGVCAPGDDQAWILESAITSIGDAVIVADEEGQILIMNPAARRLFGADEDLLADSAGLAPARCAAEAAGSIPQTILARVLAGDAVDECDILLPPTSVRPGKWLTVSGRLLVDAARQSRGAVLVARDTSERKSREEIIRVAQAELEGRVEERTRALAAVNRELVHRNEENEAFVQSVSHDLRSPLVNLLGFNNELGQIHEEIRSLIRADAIPAESKPRLDELFETKLPAALLFIETAGQRMSRIIDALLRLARVGRVAYRFAEVDLSATVARAIAGLTSTILDRGAHIVCGDLPRVIGDATAIEQVFANLIGNSLHYLDPNRPGEIEIGVRPSATDAGPWRFAMLYVQDNGLGIPERSFDRVFRAFERIHPSAAPGEGVGLAMTKRIVERHAGRIWFESTAGVGTTFYVELPMAARLEPELAPPSAGSASAPG